MAKHKKKASKVYSERTPLYRTYSFLDKDPIIDIMRTLAQDSPYSNAQISDASGVSKATLSNWFNGVTRKPQYCTIAAVAGALGKSIGLVNKKR
jgi:transcriptional regulator with XRE-family HTH domain